MNLLNWFKRYIIKDPVSLMSDEDKKAAKQYSKTRTRSTGPGVGCCHCCECDGPRRRSVQWKYL